MKKEYLRFLFQPALTALFLLLGLVIYGKTIGPISISPAGSLPKRTFEVEGTGKVNAVPNNFQTSFTITDKGSTQKAAQGAGNKKLNEAMSDLVSIGIAKSDIKTTGYYINPDYNYTERVPVGYSINITISVKSSDLAKINKALDKLTGLGINIEGVNMTLGNEEKYKEKARQEAVSSAKAKAQELAKAGGFLLGKIATIKEITAPEIRPMPLPFMQKLGAPQSNTNLEPGTQEVTSRISITYYIKD